MYTHSPNSYATALTVITYSMVVAVARLGFTADSSTEVADAFWGVTKAI